MSWSVLQSASNTVASGNGTVTLGTNLSLGSKIICWISVSSSTGGIDDLTSVKDTAGNTLTKLVALNGGNGGDGAMWAYLLAMDTPAGDVGGTTVLTATWNTAAAANFGLTMLAQEVSGLLPGNTSAMLDNPPPGTNLGDSTGPATTGAYSSTASNEYLTAMFGDAGNAVTVTNPGGYTPDAHNITGNSNADLFVTYKNSGNTAESASFTISAVAAWGTILGAFQLGTPPIIITPSTLPQNIGIGQAYTFNLSVSGGTGSGYTWSVSSGSLPSGLSLSGTGSTDTISGTVTGSPASSTFTIEVTDGASNTGTQTYTINTINIPPATTPTFPAIPGLAVIGADTPGDPGAPPSGPTTGPVFYPAVRAIRAQLPVAPIGMHAFKGRISSNKGAPVRNPTPGPVFRQRTTPVRFVIPRWQPHGRIGTSFTAQVQVPSHGPPVYALQGPVQARFPQLHPRAGRVESSPGAPVKNPTPGPVFTQKTFPAKARAPLPARGRTYATAKPFRAAAPSPAPFFPATSPVQAKRPLFPLLRGRMASLWGAPVQNPQSGPQFTPAASPVRSHAQKPIRGRISATPAVRVKAPGVSPVFAQRTSPARAVIPQGVPGFIYGSDTSPQYTQNVPSLAASATSATASITATVGTSTNAGDDLVLVILSATASLTISSLSDTQGNVYNLQATDVLHHSTWIFTATGPTKALASGTDSISVTLSGTSAWELALIDCAGYSAVDQGISAVGSGTALSVTTNALSHPGEMAIFGFRGNGALSAVTGTTFSVSGGSANAAVSWQLQQGTAPVTGVATAPTGGWEALAVTLQQRNVAAFAPYYSTRRISASYGAPVQNPAAGPVFTQKTSPVRIHPVLPARGRIAFNKGAPVPAVVTPAPFHSRTFVKAQLPLARRGICRSIKFYPAQGNPTPGPVFTPATSPVRARFPLARRGRIASNPGIPVAPVPQVKFLSRSTPSRSRITLPLRGRIISGKGAPVNNPAKGPVFVQKTFPVRIRPQLPRRGRIGSNSGAPVNNPVIQVSLFASPNQPAGIRVIFLATGRISSNKGAPVKNPVAATPFLSRTFPARARITLPRRGRVYSNPGGPVVAPQTGSPFVQRSFIRAQQPLPRRGVCRSIKFYPAQVQPAAPVLFTSRTTPVQAKFPLPLRGRVYSNPGVVHNPQSGPVFRAATTPARSRITPPLRGRIGFNKGAPVVPVTIGPVFHPADSPIRARIPQNAPRGRVYSHAGAPVKNPQAGPVFYPAVHPAQARIPQIFSKGRVYSNSGAPVQNPTVPAPVYPLHGPVRGKIILPPRGRIAGNAGAPVHNPPAPVYPLHGPVRAALPLPHRGRTGSNPGVVVLPTIPPKVYPLKGPVQARRPLPPRGRVILGNKGAPVRNPTPGPVFRSAVHPIRGIIPQNAPRGRTNSNPGGPVENPSGSRAAVWFLGRAKGRWDAEVVFGRWQLGRVYTGESA